MHGFVNVAVAAARRHDAADEKTLVEVLDGARRAFELSDDAIVRQRVSLDRSSGRARPSSRRSVSCSVDEPLDDRSRPARRDGLTARRIPPGMPNLKPPPITDPTNDPAPLVGREPPTTAAPTSVQNLPFGVFRRRGRTSRRGGRRRHRVLDLAKRNEAGLFDGAVGLAGKSGCFASGTLNAFMLTPQQRRVST